MMELQIRIKELEPIRVVCMKYQGVATSANRLFPTVFKSIMGKSNGAPFILYLNMNIDTNIGEMELCVPTEATPNKAGVNIKHVPRIKALCVTHIGSYESLPQTYRMVEEYAIKQGIKLLSPIREVYIKGPGVLLKGNPKKYITELQFPLLEE